MEGFRKTIRAVLVLGILWLPACQAEEITIAENPNADAKTVLTNYAKHFFRGADITVKVSEDQEPPRYRLKVEQFRQHWTADGLRDAFVSDIAYIMKRISEHPTLKKYDGANQFFVRCETEDIRGVTDTSKAMSIILPNDLDVNWQSMQMDANEFLKYLNYAKQDYTKPIFVNWYLRNLKPEYWRD